MAAWRYELHQGSKKCPIEPRLCKLEGSRGFEGGIFPEVNFYSGLVGFPSPNEEGAPDHGIIAGLAFLVHQVKPYGSTGKEKVVTLTFKA